MKEARSRPAPGAGQPETNAEAAARLAAIVASSDDAIVSKTLDGIITSWNPAAERMFGWTAAQAVGQPVTLIIPRERHAEEDDVLARVRRGEIVDHFETVRVTKDGRYVDVSVTISPVKDGSGRIIGASKIARDISERRRTGEAAARLAAMVDSSEDVIIGKTLDGIITSWNPAAERMFGWTAAEAVGRHVTLIVPQDRHAEDGRAPARGRRGDVGGRRVTEQETKGGRCGGGPVEISPVKDGSGRIIGASKIARDISERRRTGEAAARLAAMVDSSEDVIIGKTLDGIITSWNPAAERMFGWTAAEAVGRHITLIVPEDRHA